MVSEPHSEAPAIKGATSAGWRYALLVAWRERDHPRTTLSHRAVHMGGQNNDCELRAPVVPRHVRSRIGSVQRCAADASIKTRIANHNELSSRVC
jgi:hypothetical protein